MTTALICIALLGLLLFGLGFAVSLTRGRTSNAGGQPTDPGDGLFKVIRAHGNTAEYAPMLALLFFIVGWREPSTWGLALMWIATASRYSLAAGVLLSPTLDKAHPLRFLGALGTYLSGLALCGVLLRDLSSGGV